MAYWGIKLIAAAISVKQFSMSIYLVSGPPSSSITPEQKEKEKGNTLD